MRCRRVYAYREASVSARPGNHNLMNLRIFLYIHCGKRCPILGRMLAVCTGVTCPHRSIQLITALVVANRSRSHPQPRMPPRARIYQRCRNFTSLAARWSGRSPMSCRANASAAARLLESTIPTVASRVSKSPNLNERSILAALNTCPSQQRS